MLPNFPSINITSPATASSRIYAGNLHKDVTLEELYDCFKNFGEVVGMKLNKNYAFVQFQEDSSAEEAIRNSGQIICHGDKVVVRPSMKGGAKQQKNQALLSTPKSLLPNDNISNDVGQGNSAMNRMRDVPNKPNPRFNDHPPQNDRDMPMNRNWQGNFPPATYYPDEVNPQIYPPPPNDCEIIVVSKMLTEYAEFIEDRLKRIGLTVDVLYPNENVPIGRVLTNIASRGCLYAILVMPENYENRSLTLNILHGLSQEHRNMPLDDAIALMARNFAEFQDTGGDNARPSILLHKLVAGKSLSVMEYDIIIQYVTECREKQIKIELGQSAVTQNLPVSSTPAAKTTDLTQRILSILDKTSIEPISTLGISSKPSVPLESSQPQIDLQQIILQSMLNKPPSSNTPQPVPAPGSGQNAILSNTTIQKALDSLKNNSF